MKSASLRYFSKYTEKMSFSNKNRKNPVLRNIWNKLVCSVVSIHVPDKDSDLEGRLQKEIVAMS